MRKKQGTSVKVFSEFQRGPMAVSRYKEPEKQRYRTVRGRHRTIWGYSVENNKERYIIGTQRKSRHKYTGSAVTVLHALCSMAQEQACDELRFPSFCALNRSLRRANTGRVLDELDDILELWGDTRLVVIDKASGKFRRCITSALKECREDPESGEYVISVNDRFLGQFTRPYTRLRVEALAALQRSPAAQNLYRYCRNWLPLKSTDTQPMRYENVFKLGGILGMSSTTARELRRQINRAANKVNEHNDKTGFIALIDWKKRGQVAQIGVLKVA